MNNCKKVFLCDYSLQTKNECKHAQFPIEPWKRCIHSKAIVDGMTYCLNKEAQKNSEEDI